MSTLTIPVTFQDIVDEIVRFTSICEAEAKHRVWLEAISFGWNVAEDVRRYNVTPHVYDDRMERLYCEGSGFIFETLVYWTKPHRQQWTAHAVDRVENYLMEHGISPEHARILMLGDGAGNDSLIFASRGLPVDYFEVPGSKTFDFAMRRFQQAGLLGQQIKLVEDFDACLSGSYDIVLSFEVLEHLPDPRGSIRSMGAMLKEGGIALVSEGFAALDPSFPTHLESNERFAGRTPFLFLSNQMVLGWYSRRPLFKPMEFTKARSVSWRDRLQLLADRAILTDYFGARVAAFERRLKKRLWGDVRPATSEDYGTGHWTEREQTEPRSSAASRSAGQHG